MEEFASEK